MWCANRVPVHVAPVDFRSVVQIGRVPVAAQVISRRADGEILADRHIDHAFEFHRVVIAVFDIGRHFGLADHRRRGVEIDHPRRGVTSEQRPLWPAQDFDLRQIVKFAFEQAGLEQRRIVQMDRRRAVATFADAQIANTANGKARRGKIGLGKRDVGQRQLQVAGRPDLLTLECLGRKGADRDRHVLQTLRLTLCRNNYFLNAVGIGFGRRCCRLCNDRLRQYQL